MHFQGMICSYSGLPAADACPFATPGVVNLSPGRTDQRCEHTAAFMASEAAAAVVASQQNEINVRNASKELDSVRVQLVEAATALENAQQAFQVFPSETGGDKTNEIHRQVYLSIVSISEIKHIIKI